MGAVSTVRLSYPISCSVLPNIPENPDYSHSQSSTADPADLQSDPLDKQRHNGTHVHTQTNITQRNYDVQA
jgi:kynurenine formamidase